MRPITKDDYYSLKYCEAIVKEVARILPKNSFIMFGGGLRLCPGNKLTMIELVCLIALLFRKYEINLVDMDFPKTMGIGVTVFCVEFLVEIKPRN
ncbi:hypothetical protein RhiirC2_775321 [Rhizophagus irregularis]|uniref:Cytochrome P450 n=1 Tax=Rhizophagus irregularis TaxID=588596 RepID=A0A2N1NJF0_9GLOM|nr:hypothetical protein RhiirC2_775321 [Rhizophagus irregularis]